MADLDSNNGTINPRSLNDFPEHLLLHILTFLPTLDAVRSSLLSRKWRNLWSTIPSLNFDYSLFPSSPSDTRRRFASFVDQTLILRSPSPLLKLKFQFHFAEYFYRSHIDSWIHYAINHNAVELDIDFYIDREYHICNIDNDDGNDNDNDNNSECDYDFNFCFLRNSRVTDLKICRCDLILPHNMSASKFGSIKSVYLDQIYLADEMVVDLILGCVNLEKMVLDYCYGMKSLRICSSKLKELSLWCFHTQNEEEESLEICCPNLRSISIINFQMGKYCIKDSNSLVEAHVEFLQELRNYSYWSKVARLFTGVKRFTVQNWWFKMVVGEMYLKGRAEQVRAGGAIALIPSLRCLIEFAYGGFPIYMVQQQRSQKDSSSGRFALNNLKHLRLQTEYTKHDLLGMAALFKICPNITTLMLDDLFKVDPDEGLSEELLNKPLNLSIPNLKIVKLKNYGGTENELQFLMLVKKHGTVMEKIVISQEANEISFPLRGSSAC
ncbi:hypothetical protein LguiA_035227 [Lonicera macranthoides]